MPEHPKAKRIVDALAGAENEFRLKARASSGASAELAELDAAACANGAGLIKTLDTEVFRLRQAIGCYLHGRLDRGDLRKIAETWNGD